MKIIIAGLGKLGWAAADRLLSEGHEVTAIDSRPERVMQAANSLDLIALQGNAADCDALQTAGAATADILIAATAGDEQNLVSCMVARRLGVRHTVARVRDTVYLRQAVFMRESFGLSRLINPEQETAVEISRLLRLPAATRVDSFAHGNLELAACQLNGDSPLLGRSLSQLSAQLRAWALVCAVERRDQVLIPKGSFKPQEGDKLHVAARPPQLRAFFQAAGVGCRPVHSVLVLGGSRVAVYLARNLAEHGVRVRIVERDEARCQQLSVLLPRAEIIHGDGGKRELLLEAGLDTVDGFVTLTGSDEVNLILALYARRLGAAKVVAKVNEEQLTQLLTDAGVDCCVQPKRLVVEQLAQYARALQNANGSAVEELRTLAGGRVEALEFLVSERSRCLHTPLRLLSLRDDVLLAAVSRGDATFLPDGDTCLQARDRVMVVTTQPGLRDLDSILLGNGVK